MTMTATRAPRITPRQREVFLAYARGYGLLEISTSLGLAPGSAGAYLGRLRDRVGAQNNAQLAVILLQRGLMTAEEIGEVL